MGINQIIKNIILELGICIEIGTIPWKEYLDKEIDKQTNTEVIVILCRLQSLSDIEINNLINKIL